LSDIHIPLLTHIDSLFNTNHYLHNSAALCRCFRADFENVRFCFVLSRCGVLL